MVVLVPVPAVVAVVVPVPGPVLVLVPVFVAGPLLVLVPVLVRVVVPQSPQDSIITLTLPEARPPEDEIMEYVNESFPTGELIAIESPNKNTAFPRNEVGAI